MLAVAIAVIEYEGRYLVARRADDKPEGGKLEFVGGKLADGECAYTALLREIREELGVCLAGEHYRHLGDISNQARGVCLHTYLIHLIADSYATLHAKRVGAEQQPLFWLDKPTLQQRMDDFPVANRQIFDWLD